MSNYKRLTAKECAERLLKIEKPIVFIHVRPDGDATGSGAALCELFRQLGRDCALLSADRIPARLEFILEKTATKVADTAEGFTPVSIDVASPSQLGSLIEYEDKPALMIDHHAVGESFADYYIAPKASSAAEALIDIIDELEAMGLVKMNGTLAYALYAAISSDTGCFAYSNAGPKTHRCAARLIEYGIDSADINHRLFNSKSKEQLKAEGFVASKLKSDMSGKVAYAAITLAEREELGLESEHFDTAIDIVRSILGAEIAFVVKEGAPQKYKISLRSTGADVSRIAAELGGGGHVRAAGCSATAENIDVATNIIIEKIKNIL